MSVQEMIAKLDELSADELSQLREALDRVQAELDTSEEERWREGESAMRRLMRGVGTSGGKHLSVGIDEALYRDEA